MLFDDWHVKFVEERHRLTLLRTCPHFTDMALQSMFDESRVNYISKEDKGLCLMCKIIMLSYQSNSLSAMFSRDIWVISAVQCIMNHDLTLPLEYKGKLLWAWASNMPHGMQLSQFINDAKLFTCYCYRPVVELFLKTENVFPFITDQSVQTRGGCDLGLIHVDNTNLFLSNKDESKMSGHDCREQHQEPHISCLFSRTGFLQHQLEGSVCVLWFTRLREQVESDARHLSCSVLCVPKFHARVNSDVHISGPDSPTAVHKTYAQIQLGNKREQATMRRMSEDWQERAFEKQMRRSSSVPRVFWRLVTAAPNITNPSGCEIHSHAQYMTLPAKEPENCREGLIARLCQRLASTSFQGALYAFQCFSVCPTTEPTHERGVQRREQQGMSGDVVQNAFIADFKRYKNTLPQITRTKDGMWNCQAPADDCFNELEGKHCERMPDLRVAFIHGYPKAEWFFYGGQVRFMCKMASFIGALASLCRLGTFQWMS